MEIESSQYEYVKKNPKLIHIYKTRSQKKGIYLQTAIHTFLTFLFLIQKYNLQCINTFKFAK